MDIVNDLESYEIDLDYEYEHDIIDGNGQLINEVYDIYNSEYTNEMNFQDVTKLCIIPTLTETCKNYFTALGLCFFFQILNKTGLVAPRFGHLICGCLGIFIMYLHFQKNFQNTIFHSIILPIISYLVICQLSRTRHLTSLVSALFLGYLTICEFIVDPSSWSRIRSVQMIITMKVISLVSDLQNRRISVLPTYSQFFGYIFCVSNNICGPWINFTFYLNMFSHKNWNLGYFFKILRCVLMSLIFFVMSTCYLDWFIPDVSNTDMYIVYKTALTFRTSHYFVSFMSESLLLASGLVPTDSEDEVIVTKSSKIEYPHSLVEVAIYWNIPMHKWLKMYVFRPLCNCNRFIAVTGTYFISSLLHGLNYQLTGVLLSLAIYTFIEHVLRHKLATKFDACILSKACQFDCQRHRYTRRMLIIVLINLSFTILAIYHLSYLGYLIDQTCEHNLSFQQSFQRWHKLSYSSHVLAAVTFVIYLIL